MDRSIKLALKLTLCLFSGVLVLTAIFSLQWRFQHDTPIMLYLSFLMNRFGSVPYRDFFDMNIPGTYFIYCLIGYFSRYTDIGVRFADLIILSIILSMNWLWMKKLSWKAAWCGSILWGLVYLKFGPDMSLQREYLILLPIVGGIFVPTLLQNNNSVLRNFLTGLFWGLAATIKPHAAIGLPLLLAFEYANNRQENTAFALRLRVFIFSIVLPAALGFAIPISGMLLYVWMTGAIRPFLDIALHYWPLYTRLTDSHETIAGLNRMLYLMQNYRYLGGFRLWLAPAVLGIYVSLYNSTLNASQKRQVILLIGLVVCYSLYPVIAGQFWSYHWLLFLYFIIQLGSLCLIEQPNNTMTGAKLLPVAVILLTIMCGASPSRIIIDQINGREPPPPKEGVVDEIAAHLKANLRPGDTVQPLDWTGGAVHAMLISEARLATPFVYDFHFYHHVSNPYIQNLRRKCILNLQKSQPRFIVQVIGNDKPWVSGKDTTRDFSELQSLLEEKYRAAATGNGYIIYELCNDFHT